MSKEIHCVNDATRCRLEWHAHSSSLFFVERSSIIRMLIICCVVDCRTGLNYNYRLKLPHDSRLITSLSLLHMSKLLWNSFRRPLTCACWKTGKVPRLYLISYMFIYKLPIASNRDSGNKLSSFLRSIIITLFSLCPVVQTFSFALGSCLCTHDLDLNLPQCNGISVCLPLLAQGFLII